jgi:alginate O-acetyltransferase complex protein AlgI
MLFNSYEYILCFLPISLIIYFLLNKYKLTLASKTWLVITSLLFYGWWNFIYLPLILGSIFFNYAIGTSLAKKNNKYPKARKIIFLIGIIGNILLLGYFKYSDFFIANINYISKLDLQALNIILPLGISFFTFTQIAYLVDTYHEFVKEYDLLNYSLFVTFFPHLLAGPIIHHSEMMPQFNQIKNKIFSNKNFSLGIYLFAIGLFKKVIIADSFAVWANQGYAQSHLLKLIEAWITSLSYTLQLYFDFSGYTDMAIGSALMFNIVLPINFNTPYLAGNIQDFWRRWHITLSRFLRDYIYIPLGGNRISESRTLSNLVATFLIGGIWHGAGWTYVFWGLLHGIAMVIHRFWKKSSLVMPKILAWFITFNFVNFAWIFFRAKNFDEALSVLRAMVGLNGISLPSSTANILGGVSKFGVKFAGGEWSMSIVTMLPVFIIISIFFKNSNQMTRDFKPSYYNLLGAVFLLGTSLFSMLTIKSEFIYFNF